MQAERCISLEKEFFPFISSKAEKLLDNLGVNPNLKAKALIIIDEYSSNLLKNNPENDTLQLSLVISWNTILEIVLEDNGIAFNPNKDWKMPVISDKKEKQTGGLGIFLMHHLADKMVYSYKEGKNKTKFEFH